MQAVILKCPPRAQFHFGKIALDVDTSLDETEVVIHSDTLFSAIIVTVDKIFPKESNSFVQYFREGKIRISSAFHCFEKSQDDYVWFLPKPAHYNVLEKPVDNEDRKWLGRVQFVSKRVWELGLKPSEWNDDCVILQKEFVLHKDELPGWNAAKIGKLEVYQTHSLPKVSIHKPSKEDSIYFQTNVLLAANAKVAGAPKIHYYFLLDTPGLPEPALTKLKTVLAVIADAGIGGERSVGCGRLEGVDFQDFSMNVSGNGALASVSLINPAEGEMNLLKSWELVTRGGRQTEKDGKLKRVKMLSEGALLAGEVAGRLVSVANGNTAYLRNGKGFSLPVHQNALPA
ncbi:MAG: type III-A CRISPR-associated RAMP protein Csm4 [Saprospiraceae bacterium]|nr:MAG: type III-A CRISPR-associated RAMP protein Csm4 [Saprospiraceae bacterium]